MSTRLLCNPQVYCSIRHHLQVLADVLLTLLKSAAQHSRNIWSIENESPLLTVLDIPSANVLRFTLRCDSCIVVFWVSAMSLKAGNRIFANFG